MYREHSQVVFPEFQNTHVNMMPIIFGDLDSVPKHLRRYGSMIEQCDLKPGTTVYLTVDEKFLNEGDFLRRPGIHTDGTNALGWGGGWGYQEGIYLASNDGRCKVWDSITHNVDHLGGLLGNPEGDEVELKPNTMYWITDRTPHESLSVEKTGVRQFFRLVSDGIGAWFAQHSTPNPLGVEPMAPIVNYDKFEA